MPQFLIERDLPGAGSLTPAQLREIARKSVGVLNAMGPTIQWVHSYVAGNALYCVYRAPSEEPIREHARLGGFAVTRVTPLVGMIDPVTAE